MKTLKTVGELRQELVGLNDDDIVVIETIDLKTGDTQDLYPFYIDIIGGIKLTNGKEVQEIRFCQQPNT